MNVASSSRSARREAPPPAPAQPSALGSADASPRQAAAPQPSVFRIAPLRPVDELRREALLAQPPEEKDLRPSELVEIVALGEGHADLDGLGRLEAGLAIDAGDLVQQVQRQRHTGGHGRVDHEGLAT